MIPTQFPTYLRREIAFPANLSTGSKGMTARRAQEWLSYHGFQTTIDGGYGPATERTCKAFQTARGLSVSGKVDRATWGALVSPLLAAVADVSAIGASFDSACLKVAKQHLKQHPIELGGDNRGPWVRAYVNGNDGNEWLWCAGFVSFLMTQAALQMGVNKPITAAFPVTRFRRRHLRAGASSQAASW